MRPSHLVVKSLKHGSWSGKHSTKKPSRGKGVPAINLSSAIHCLVQYTVHSFSLQYTVKYFLLSIVFYWNSTRGCFRSVLQCVAVNCKITLKSIIFYWNPTRGFSSSVLQCVAVSCCCSVLQCVAVYWSAAGVPGVVLVKISSRSLSYTQHDLFMRSTQAHIQVQRVIHTL